MRQSLALVQWTSGHRDAVNGNGDRICTPVHDGDRCSDGVVATVVAQLLVGVVNLLLLAPIGMQLAHLLLANLLWISLVVWCWNAEGQPGIAVDGSKIPSCCHASNVVGTNSAI
jgi:hypothetical protein